MEFKPRAAALTCILMFATFLEMSFFFFLYERCPECLLSIAFILTYWILVSSLNMVLGLSFIILTGKTDPARKRAVVLIGALVLIALLTLVNYAICTSFQ